MRASTNSLFLDGATEALTDFAEEPTSDKLDLLGVLDVLRNGVEEIESAGFYMVGARSIAQRLDYIDAWKRNGV